MQIISKHKYKYAPVPAHWTTRAHTASPDQNINRTKKRDIIGKDQRALSSSRKESGSGSGSISPAFSFRWVGVQSSPNCIEFRNN